MRKILSSFIVLMLLLTTIFSIGAIAGDPENPEFEDRILDVKLFGLIRWIFQSRYKNMDVQSAWMSEDADEPEYLIAAMKLRDLEIPSENDQINYVLTFLIHNHLYNLHVQINNDGVSDFSIGKSLDEDDQIDDSIIIEGILDVENDIITWKIPKNYIDDYQIGVELYDIRASTHLQKSEKTPFLWLDLFKDLPGNAKLQKTYTFHL